MEQKEFFEKGFGSKEQWLVYGFLYPAGLIAACMLAEYLQRL